MKEDQGFDEPGLIRSHKKALNDGLVKNGFFTNLAKELFYVDIEKGKKVASVVAAGILFRETSLKFMRVYGDTKNYFVYNEELGIYTLLTLNGVLAVITAELAKTGDVHLTGSNYAKSILEDISIGTAYRPGPPIQDKKYTSFQNGVYCKESGTLLPHTPRHFVSNSLPYEYNPDCPIPKFMKYLNHITEGNLDREKLFRLNGYLALWPSIDFHKFFYIHGRGGTGKSTWSKVLQAVTGSHNVLSSTLPLLSKNSFENGNLIDKNVLIINEQGQGPHDFTVVKILTGNDKIPVRIKFIQGSFDIHANLVVVMFSNFPFQDDDTSDSLWRRVISIPVNNVPAVVENMLSTSDGYNWAGKLKDELPGIWSYFNSMPKEDIDLILNNFDIVCPSLIEEHTLIKEGLNPMQSWIRNCCIEGFESPVGYYLKESESNSLNAKKSGCLFYNYLSFCKMRQFKPKSHQDFSSLVIQTANAMGFNCVGHRRKGGSFIRGIRLNLDIFTAEYLTGLGDPQETLKGEMPSSSYPNAFIPSLPGKQHPSLKEGVVEKYIGLLKETPLKKQLQVASKRVKPSWVPRITDKYLLSNRLKDPTYRERCLKTIGLHIRKLQKFGILSYEYQAMGDSLMPVKSKNASMFFKKIVKHIGYAKMTIEAKRLGYDVFDLDISSCSASVIFGLYPTEVAYLKMAMSSGGLWDYIEKEFIAQNVAEYYEKPLVKAAVYSSYFGKGKTAYKGAIMDKHCDELGVSMTQLKALSTYDEMVKRADKIVETLMKSTAVQSFRSVSKHFKRLYSGKMVTGPSGSTFEVSDESARFMYSNYLMDFERVIKAQFCWNLREKFPGTEILDEPHDGVLVAIPSVYNQDVESFLEINTKEIGLKLGLKHTIAFEIAAGPETLISRDFNGEV